MGWMLLGNHSIGFGLECFGPEVSEYQTQQKVAPQSEQPLQHQTCAVRSVCCSAPLKLDGGHVTSKKAGKIQGAKERWPVICKLRHHFSLPAAKV